GRPSFFLGAALGRGATRFLGASFVFRSALDGRTIFGDPTLGRDALLFRTALGCGLLDGGTFRRRAFRRRGLLARAKLFLLAPLLRHATLFRGARFGRAHFGGDALFFREACFLRAPFFSGAQFQRLALRRDASRLFGEPFLFRVPRERGVVDSGEGLFVFDER